MKQYGKTRHNTQRCYTTKRLIAELRRPEGPPSGAPYSYWKEKETHKLIFSWLSWIAVLLVGAYPSGRQRRRRIRTTWRLNSNLAYGG